MCAQRSTEFQRRQAFEDLAQKSQVPIDEVAQLYQDEWARLAHGARITGFLAILTLRNVRARLRGRGSGTKSIP